MRVVYKIAANMLSSSRIIYPTSFYSRSWTEISYSLRKPFFLHLPSSTCMLASSTFFVLLLVSALMLAIAALWSISAWSYLCCNDLRSNSNVALVCKDKKDLKIRLVWHFNYSNKGIKTQQFESTMNVTGQLVSWNEGLKMIVWGWK